MDEKTLQVVKELMASQERAYRSAIELIFSEVKNDIRNLSKDIQDWKSSLQFSQKDIQDLDAKMKSVEVKLRDQQDTLTDVDEGFVNMSDQIDYLKNQSRRSNLKILGLPEGDKELTWEDTENVVRAAVKEHLGFQEDLQIERAHRIGKPRLPGAKRRDGRASEGPRGIVAKMSSWKQKEQILKAARDKRPDGVMFVPDYSQRILDRRSEKKQELLKARSEGKVAYFIMDRLIVKPNRKKKPAFSPVNCDSEISFDE